MERACGFERRLYKRDGSVARGSGGCRLKLDRCGMGGVEAAADCCRLTLRKMRYNMRYVEIVGRI